MYREGKGACEQKAQGTGFKRSHIWVPHRCIWLMFNLVSLFDPDYGSYRNALISLAYDWSGPLRWGLITIMRVTRNAAASMTVLPVKAAEI